jgi:hypothetical protein
MKEWMGGLVEFIQQALRRFRDENSGELAGVEVKGSGASPTQGFQAPGHGFKAAVQVVAVPVVKGDDGIDLLVGVAPGGGEGHQANGGNATDANRIGWNLFPGLGGCTFICERIYGPGNKHLLPHIRDFYKGYGTTKIIFYSFGRGFSAHDFAKGGEGG